MTDILKLGTDEVVLTRSWFAKWLSRYSIAQLIPPIGRKSPSLVSKFRSGAALPRTEHFIRYAQVLGDVEFVLAPIALVDEFEPLRFAVDRYIADPGTDETPHRALNVDRSVRDEQLDRRLSEAARLNARRSAPSSSAFVVPDGHGATSLQRRLLRNSTFTDVLDLSASELSDDEAVKRVRQHTARDGVAIVVPRSREWMLKEEGFSGSIETVDAVDWVMLFRSLTSAEPAGAVDLLGARMIGEVRLDLCVRALQGYHAHRTRPLILVLPPTPERQTEEVALSSGPLSPTQRTILAPVLSPRQRDVGLVVPSTRPELSGAVVRYLADVGACQPLLSESSSSEVIELWARLIRDEKWSPLVADPLENPTQAVAVDLGVSARAVGEALFEAIRLIDARQPSVTWRFCGPYDDVVRAASGVADAIEVVTVPDWPAPAADSKAEGMFIPLPSIVDWTPAKMINAFYGAPYDLAELDLLHINGVLEIQPGQGCTAATLALMQMRAQTTAELLPTFISLEHYAEPSRVRTALHDVGLRDSVAGPYFGAPPEISDEEVQAAAETICRRVFSLPRVFKPAGTQRVFLDLSPTRFGRVPRRGRRWNEQERLASAYEEVAVELLNLVASANPDARLIVTVPTGFSSMDRFASPADWEIHRVEPLVGEATRQIFKRHGTPTPSSRIVRLLCSLTTLQAVNSTGGGF